MPRPAGATGRCRGRRERRADAAAGGSAGNKTCGGNAGKKPRPGIPRPRETLPYFCRKPMYSSSTLNSMSPEQTGSTASVPGMGTYSNRSRAPVSTRAGITS